MSPRALRFAELYAVSRNGTKAALEAGYSTRNAASQASNLLADPKVREEIDKRIAKASMRTQLTVERVQEEMARLAFSDPAELVDKDTGQLRNLHEIPHDTRAVISSIENEELFEGQGKDREHIGTLRKVKLWDKGKALDLAARHLGMVGNASIQVGQLTLIIQD